LTWYTFFPRFVISFFFAARILVGSSIFHQVVLCSPFFPPRSHRSAHLLRHRILWHFLFWLFLGIEAYHKWQPVCNNSSFAKLRKFNFYAHDVIFAFSFIRHIVKRNSYKYAMSFVHCLPFQLLLKAERTLWLARLHQRLLRCSLSSVQPVAGAPTISVWSSRPHGGLRKTTLHSAAMLCHYPVGAWVKSFLDGWTFLGRTSFTWQIKQTLPMPLLLCGSRPRCEGNICLSTCRPSPYLFVHFQTGRRQLSRQID
jgi:hypothetical protein